MHCGNVGSICWPLLLIGLIAGDVDSSESQFGPFHPNQDVLCNRNGQFACFCSTVTWRRFSRTEAPLCQRRFPNVKAVVLEMSQCDVRLDNDPHKTEGFRGREAQYPTEFERHFKRTLATLIVGQCQRTPTACPYLSGGLTEEQVLFVGYQCARDLSVSRLWTLVLTRLTDQVDDNDPEAFFDSDRLADILSRPDVRRSVDFDLQDRRSRLLTVGTDRLVDSASINGDRQSEQDPDGRLGNDENVEDILNGRRNGTSTNGDDDDENASAGWVTILVVSLLVLYFVCVWILACVICIRQRREIQRNIRQHVEEAKNDKRMVGNNNTTDKSAKEKLMASNNDDSEDENA